MKWIVIISSIIIGSANEEEIFKGILETRNEQECHAIEEFYTEVHRDRNYTREKYIFKCVSEPD